MLATQDPALWASLMTIAGVWLVTVMSPGPNFLATVHTAVRRSRTAGLLVVLGITLGTALWAAGSLLGLGLLFQTAAWLYLVVKFAGAAYLILVGIQILLSARKPVAVDEGAATSETGWRAFRLGLLTDLSNPKAAAFFTSLFAVTVPPEAPLWFDLLVIFCVVATAGIWYALVAFAIVLDPIAALYRHAARGITAVTGVVFVALGLRLAAER